MGFWNKFEEGKLWVKVKDNKNNELMSFLREAEKAGFELANQFKNMINEKFGNDLTISFSIVNPTIGEHCGPDCIGVSFHSKKR